MNKRRVKFITLEGLEGSGKSSAVSFLKEYLEKKGYSVVTFRDPGSTVVGEKIRKLLLDKNLYITPVAELLLYLAARTQLIEEKLKKILLEEVIDFVICDRFFDSTFAYQGYGLGLERLVEEGLKLFFPQQIVPDLTLLLDTKVEVCLPRIKKKDRIESRSKEFYYAVRRGYIELSKRYPSRIKLIDANRALEAIYKEIKKIIEEWLEK